MNFVVKLQIVYGEMVFEGDYPTFITTNQRWLFKQLGIFRTTVHIQESNSEKSNAIYKAGLGHNGTVRFINDKKSTFRWKYVGPQNYVWLNSQKEDLITFIFSPNEGTIKLNTENQIPNFELLVLTGFYFAISSTFIERRNSNYIDGTPGHGGIGPYI